MAKAVSLFENQIGLLEGSLETYSLEGRTPRSSRGKFEPFPLAFMKAALIASVATETKDSTGRDGPVDFEHTKRVLAALEEEKVRYVLIGGVALNLIGLPRATLDIDLFVEPEERNIERLKHALRRVFDDPMIEDIRSEDLLGEYPAVQYVPPTGTFSVDILTRLGDAFRYEDLESQRIPFEEIVVTVATPLTLYRMKKGTVRPRDWDDAISLRRRFGIEED